MIGRIGRRSTTRSKPVGKLLDWIGGPVTGLVSSVGGVIDNMHTSGEEKLEAQRALLEIERSFQGQLLEAEASFAKSQAEVLKTEIASSSWLAANWRPILMLVFTYIIAHNFVIAPLFSIEYLEIPIQMWELLKLGIGGYIGGRTLEKILPNTKLAK